MKKLLMTAAIAALIASPAAATYTEIPVPEIEVGGGGGADVAALLLLLGIGAVILMQQNDDDDLSTPRPTVLPQDCLDKRGAVVAC